MLRGIYSAAAGMTSQLLQADITSDNLANVGTPGFKPSSVQVKSFQENLIDRMTNKGPQKLGNFSKGAEVQDTVVHFIQGDIVQTGNPLDLGLKGDGFFALKAKSGELRYTRAGSFTLDNERYIAAEDGSRLQAVIPEGGDPTQDTGIKIPTNASEIKIDDNGYVMADNRRVGRLKLVQFENNNVLRKMGANSYVTNATPKAQAEGLQVAQGYIEKSAANAISELVSSMTGLRTYESLQKSIQMQNETLQQAVRDVGRPL